MVTPKGLCSGVMLGVGGSIPPQLTKRKVFFDILVKGYGSEIISSKAQTPEKVASRDSNYLCREVVNG